MTLIDFDKWQEILANLWQHKIRSFMTAILVSWGIFMLVFLLGAGKGLQNGVERQFQGFAKNTMWVWTWKTAMPYKGLQPNRRIQLTINDLTSVRKNVKGIEHITPRLGMWGTLIYRKDKNGSYDVMGINEEYFNIAQFTLIEGRFINLNDINNKSKHVLIGKSLADNLFDSSETIIGNYIEIKSVPFKVVGVFKSNSFGEEAKEDEESAFIAYTSAQQAFNFNQLIGNLIITIQPGFSSAEIENNVKSELKTNHTVHPDDDMAIGSWSSAEQFEIFNGLFMGINSFIIFVALGTIFAGMIAISVIMMITVKERTREIGVRKALGATPSSIVWLILQEAMFINIISGIVGLFVGVFLIDKLGQLFESMGIENEYFYNPEVDFSVALISFLFLMGSGFIAGLIPAIKASSIKPIEALRAD